MLEKGIIIGIEKHFITVLTKDNGYHKLPRKPTMYISQEIEFNTSHIIGKYLLAKRLALVAAAIVIIVGIAFFINMRMDKSSFLENTVAYLSLDINPSLQFAIDDEEKIVDVNYLNKDAEELMKDFAPKGMQINEALYIIINRCREKGILKMDEKNSFLLSGSFDLDNDKTKGKKGYSNSKIDKLLNGLKSDIDSLSGGLSEVLVVKLDLYDLKAAQKKDISYGRYALYKEFEKQGKGISIDDIRSFSVSDLIKAYKDIKENNATYTSIPEVSNSSKALNTKAATLMAQTYTPNSTITPAPTQGGARKVYPSTSDIIPGQVKTPKGIYNFTPIPEETGTGLRGEYYDNIDLTNLKYTCIDKQINFYWPGGTSPYKEIRNDDSYSIRWMGQIKPEMTDQYTFYATRDNGVRLWIDNKLIIDKWNAEWNVTDSGSIFLNGGKKYDIKIEYTNNSGNGKISLMWSNAMIKRSIVPTSCLFPSTAKLPVRAGIPGEGTGLSREYYDNSNLTSLKLTGTDQEINFNWGSGSPDKVIKQDGKYSIRWTGFVQPLFDEDYTFYINYDGGVRLWINDKLEVNDWAETYKTLTQTRRMPLKGGRKYKIKIEYFNEILAGKIKLEWSSHSTERSIVPMSRLFPAG
ncbi:MAG: PA14 domain-containing protein [Bacillota bacterium]|nr:PA14 domain-containing protein [Bacillota bacterium]